MQDNVSVIVATIVAVIIIVLFPIYNIATRQDSIANNMVVKATTNFVDEVRNKGYIDKESYGKYLNELDKTGNTYEVEMEVYKPILLADVNAAGEYEEKYEIEYTDEILLDMSNSGLLKTEEGIIKSNVKYLDSDYKFYVRVKNTNITQAQILLERLLRGKQNERIVVNYGGIVYANEWQLGESAETANANASISRPLNNELKEFKYEYITDVYDQYTDEKETIYGIAVRLRRVAGEDKIKFILTYTNVNEIIDNNGKNDEESVENYIKEYIEVEGITIKDNDIEVEQKSKIHNSKGYSYQFIITLSNIEYDYYSHPYMESKVKIKSGAVNTNSGIVGEINSKDFIVFYEPENLEIEEAAVTYYNINNNVTFNKAIYSVITVKLNKENAKIVDIRYAKGEYTIDNFKIEGFGESIKNSYSSTSNRYTTSNILGKRITENGKYTIYAKDIYGKEAVKVVDITSIKDNIEIVCEIQHAKKDFFNSGKMFWKFPTNELVEKGPYAAIYIRVDEEASNVARIWCGKGKYTIEEMENGVGADGKVISKEDIIETANKYASAYSYFFGSNYKDNQHSCYTSGLMLDEFKINENGTYTIYVKNKNGRASVKHVKVTNVINNSFRISLGNFRAPTSNTSAFEIRYCEYYLQYENAFDMVGSWYDIGKSRKMDLKNYKYYSTISFSGKGSIMVFVELMHNLELELVSEKLNVKIEHLDADEDVIHEYYWDQKVPIKNPEGYMYPLFFYNQDTGDIIQITEEVNKKANNISIGNLINKYIKNK